MNCRNILLVEDNPMDRELIRTAMEKACPLENILTAGSGEDALVLLREGSPPPGRDLSFILLDIKLPGMSGIDLLRDVKMDESLRSIPVVMFTSSREKSDIDECYRLGVNGYVVKPIHFTGYVETLRSISDFWSGINVLPE